MSDPSVPLEISPVSRRRGRPPGARNRRSIDLARYVEATFAGLTPGQVAAQIALPTAREVKRAKADAQELGIVDRGLDPVTLALACKAARLASALGIQRAEAWAAMMKEREGLMAFIHSKPGPTAPAKPGDRATVFMVPDGGEAAPPALALDDDETLDFLEDFSGAGEEVAQPKSQDTP